MSANPNLKLNVLNDSGSQIFFVNQTTGVNSTLISTYTNTTTSTNSSSASFVLSGGLSVRNTSNSSSYTAGGAVTIAGGIAVGNDSFIGGTVYTPRVSSGSVSTPGLTVGTVYVTSITGGTIQVSGNTSIGSNLAVAGLVQFNSTAVSTNSSTGSVVLRGGISVTNATNASSYTQGGAVTVAGGVAVGNDAYVGGTIYTPRVSSGSMATQGLTVGTLYVNSITSGNIQVSGDVTIGGSLTVLGSTTVLNVTTANQIETNVTSSNIFLLGNLIAGGNSHTLGNIFTTGGNVGINTTSPGATLDVSGTARFTTSVSTANVYSTNLTTTNIVGTNVSLGTVNATGVQRLLNTTVIQATTNNYSLTSGALNITGDAVISGTNEFMFTQTGVGGPTMNGRSSGTKVVLYPQTGVTQGDYSVGIESMNTWFQVPTINTGYKFYQGTTASLTVSTGGNVNIISTANITTISSGTILATNLTGTNLVSTALSSGTFNVSTVTASSILASTSITTANVYSTNITATNGVFTRVSGTNNILTNITSNTVVVTGGGLNATFNSNTIGSIITTGGNVGIGTTGPSYTLDVNGNFLNAFRMIGNSLFTYNNITTGGFTVSINSNDIAGACFPLNVQIAGGTGSTQGRMIRLNNSSSALFDIGVNSNSQFSIYNSSITNLLCITTGGNVGIGTTSPGQALEVVGGFKISSNVNITNDQQAAYFWNQSGIGPTFAGHSFQIRTGGDTPRLHITQAGNVGIGTTSAANTLDVSGTGRITTSLTTGALYSTNQTTTNGVFTNLSSGTISLTTLSSANIYASLGTVSNLVGTNLSSSNLISTVATIPNIIHTNITTTSIIVTGGGLLATFNSNTIGTLFTTNGNVGINTTSPSYRFEVNGTTSAPVGIFYPSVSNNTTVFFVLGKGATTNNAAEIRHFHSSDDSNQNAIRLGAYAAGDFMTVRYDGNVGIGTTSPGTKLDVNGTGRIATSLTTGSLFSTNITSTNAVFTACSSGTFVGTTTSTANIYSSLGTISNLVGTNISATNLNAGVGIFSTGITSGIGWFTNSLTVGNLFATNFTVSSLFATTLTLGTVLMTTGITSPNIFVTNLTATNELITNSSISSARITNQVSTNISASTLNVTGLTAGNINFTGSLYQNGSIYISSQWTTFGTNLAYTTGNVGINTTSPGYKLDVNGDTRIRSTVFSTNSTSGALVMAGGVSITGTNAASNTMGGSLTVAGGTSISQDLYVGGNVYIRGIDNTLITGTQVIGSNTATGTYQASITLPRTMANTAYKIVGSLKSTTNNTNVYSVSFTNVTTSGFTANIYRLDALGSGWTDTNLTLSYVVYP